MDVILFNRIPAFAGKAGCRDVAGNEGRYIVFRGNGGFGG